MPLQAGTSAARSWLPGKKHGDACGTVQMLEEARPTQCGERASKGVPSADHSRRGFATRQLQKHSCQVMVRLVRLAHSHKLLQKTCREKARG